MASAANVVAFLSPASSAFDHRLAYVMAGAVGVALLPFQTAPHWNGLRKAGLVSQACPQPPAGSADGRLLGGA